MLVKTSELVGPALDWAVAKCVIIDACKDAPEMADKITANIDPEQLQRYSTDWAQGGPLIEREFLSVVWETNDTGNILDGYWQASAYTPTQGCCYGVGPTPLIAAMRCFCEYKLGYEVEVPDELL